MFHQLSFTTRMHAFLDFHEERNLRAAVVEFKIDGRSVSEMVKFPEPPSPPKFDPGESFSALMLSSILRNMDAYQGGFHAKQWPRPSNLLALTACTDCGHADCGGVWTSVHVGSRVVFWSKLFYSNGNENGSIYDPRVFAFERQAYDCVIEEIRGLAPVEEGR